jgi:hypothetical protein
LLIADGFATSSTDTGVDGMTPADIIIGNLNLENADADALLLVRDGVLMDVVAVQTTGLNLAASTVTSGVVTGLAMMEGGTALPTPDGTADVITTLARRPEAVDTNNNFNDFQADPTPTPGAANDGVFPQIFQLLPNNASIATGTTSPVVKVLGQDFGLSSKLQVGTATPVNCTHISTSELTCTFSKGGAPALLDVTYVAPLSMRVDDIVLPKAWTWHTHVNESGLPTEADQCTVLLASTVTNGEIASSPISVRVQEAGVTDNDSNASPLVRMELGFGTAATDPRSNASWRWSNMGFVASVGMMDEYSASITPPATGTATSYAYTARVSFDGGLLWTYCDTDGAGSADTFDFSTGKLGLLTVNP